MIWSSSLVNLQNGWAESSPEQMPTSSAVGQCQRTGVQREGAGSGKGWVCGLLALGRAHLDEKRPSLLYATGIFTPSRSGGWLFTAAVTFPDISLFEYKMMLEDERQLNSED